MYVTNLFPNTVSVIATLVPPSDTTITSTVDGYGNTVQNRIFTLSTSITFTVQATAGTYPLAGISALVGLMTDEIMQKLKQVFNSIFGTKNEAL